jgi:hypothetical protein
VAGRLSVPSFVRRIHYSNRIPWSQEAENIAREQQALRTAGEIQFWLPQDKWDDTVVRVAPTKKGLKQIPSKSPSESPSASGSSKSKGKGKAKTPKTLTSKVSTSKEGVKNIQDLIN